MADEYTPEIAAFASWLSTEVADEPMWSCVVIAKRFAESEWLAAHDREVAASAIEQAANRITGVAWPPIREQLDVYAQQVREGDAVRQWGSDG